MKEQNGMESKFILCKERVGGTYRQKPGSKRKEGEGKKKQDKKKKGTTEKGILACKGGGGKKGLSTRNLPEFREKQRKGESTKSQRDWGKGLTG